MIGCVLSDTPCEKNMNAGSLKPGSGLTETQNPHKPTESSIEPTKPQKDTPQYVDALLNTPESNIEKVTPEDKNGKPVEAKVTFVVVSEHQTKIVFTPPVKAVRIVVVFKKPTKNAFISSLVCIKDEGTLWFFSTFCDWEHLI